MTLTRQSKDKTKTKTQAQTEPMMCFKHPPYAIFLKKKKQGVQGY